MKSNFEFNLRTLGASVTLRDVIEQVDIAFISSLKEIDEEEFVWQDVKNAFQTLINNLQDVALCHHIS